MITAETMRRIAPKQGDPFIQRLLEHTAGALEREGLEHVLLFLEVGVKRGKNRHERAAFAQLLEIMHTPEVIDEWTPVGGEP